MKIDDLTRKKIEKFLDSTWDDMMNHPKPKTQDFAGGAYCGALRIITLLGIEIDNRNKFE